MLYFVLTWTKVRLYVPIFKLAKQNVYKIYCTKLFVCIQNILYKQIFSMIDVNTKNIVIIIIKAVHYLLVKDQTKLEIASTLMY